MEDFRSALEVALLTVEVLGLGLHLGLDRVEGVADEGVGAPVEEARDRRAEELLLPTASLLVV